jgi:VanZ family protein
LKAVLKYQLPPLLWILVTFVLSFDPVPFFGIKLPGGSDKLFRAGEYFILCWLVQRAFYHQETFLQLKNSSLLGAFIFTCVYGVLDEYHHQLLPGRESNVSDLIAGTGGALLFTAIASLVARKKEERHS